MIELNDVSKVFSEGKSSFAAVSDVTLSIREGEVFGIVGYSGAGKSTLVRCINLLERPTSGSVTVNGQDLTKLRGRALSEARRKIGMIFQQFNLFSTRTVFDNVAYPIRYSGLSKAELKKRVESLLDFVELGDKRNAYPSQLSGGQKQRVAIARALACDPKVLLCDEATSALDPQTTKSILRLLKRLNRETGITIVMITHQMQVVKEICDRVAVMEKGRVVETGDVLDVFTHPQAPITRSFVDSASNLGGIYTLMEQNHPLTRLKPGEQIIRLQYRRDSAGEALVSRASQQFGVAVNIIFGNIELIGDEPLGCLIVKLSGGADAVRQAVDFFSANRVDVEVISDAGVA